MFQLRTMRFACFLPAFYKEFDGFEVHFGGTFTRTFLSMFEIMFANWSPPCRVLVEHVSEWFSIFFLLYRPRKRHIEIAEVYGIWYANESHPSLYKIVFNVRPFQEIME